MAIDRFGRDIHYLRISLTDHCNLRCVYCMPEDMTFRPNAELMQDDEVIELVRLFASLGFDKYRLTGGEPTVRAHIVELVGEIARVPGVRSLSMTTNGVLLPRLALPLARAGLQRVNISIDTLDADKFKRLTRWGSLDDVWQGILAAEEAGLAPIKLNAVVVRGYNEADVVDLARLTLEHPWQVRFIEMMPFAGATDLQLSQVVTAADIMMTRGSATWVAGNCQRRRAGWRGAAVSVAWGGGDGGIYLFGDRAVLRGVHTGAAHRRRAPALVPAAGRRGRPADPAAPRRQSG